MFGFTVTPSSYGLFLDVGFANMGAAIYDFRKNRVVDYACLTTQKSPLPERLSEENERRCRELVYQLLNLCQRRQFRLVCGELPHGGSKSAKAMRMMAMAVAVVSTFCATKGLKFFPITPTEIKRLVRKRGKVSKRDVEKYVERVFRVKLPPRGDVREHIADSIACIGVFKQKFNVKV